MLQRPLILDGDLKFCTEESIFQEIRIEQVTYVRFEKQITNTQCQEDKLFKGKSTITGKKVSNTFYFNNYFNKEHILNRFPRPENGM